MSDSPQVNVAPGSTVVVRDEEWLVTGVEPTNDGQLLRCQGLTELVQGHHRQLLREPGRH